MKTKTEKMIRTEMRETPAGQLLSRMGLDYYDTESTARRVAEHAAEELETLREAAKAALAVTRKRSENSAGIPAPLCILRREWRDLAAAIAATESDKRA